MKYKLDTHKNKYMNKRHARHFCHVSPSEILDFTLKTAAIAQLNLNKLRAKSGFGTHMTDVCSSFDGLIAWNFI